MPATCRLLINFGAKSLEFKGVYKLSVLGFGGLQDDRIKMSA